MEAGTVQPGQPADPSWDADVRAAHALLEAQPEAALLPALLRLHLYATAAAAAAASGEGEPAPILQLRQPTAAISREGWVAAAWDAAGPASREGEGVLVRAAADHEGGPWFDCVSLWRPAGDAAGGGGSEGAEAGEEGEGEETFAQLRLLLEYDSGEPTRAAGGWGGVGERKPWLGFCHFMLADVLPRLM